MMKSAGLGCTLAACAILLCFAVSAPAQADTEGKAIPAHGAKFMPLYGVPGKTYRVPKGSAASKSPAKGFPVALKGGATAPAVTPDTGVEQAEKPDPIIVLTPRPVEQNKKEPVVESEAKPASSKELQNAQTILSIFAGEEE